MQRASLQPKEPAELAWIDRQAVDSTGQAVGRVVDVYVSDATGEPEWLGVTTRLFGSRMSFVPTQGAVSLGEHVRVAYDRLFIKDSPNVEADGRLSAEEEVRLYRYYGMSVPEVIDLRTADEVIPSPLREVDLNDPVTSSTKANHKESEQ